MGKAKNFSQKNASLPMDSIKVEDPDPEQTIQTHRVLTARASSSRGPILSKNLRKKKL